MAPSNFNYTVELNKGLESLKQGRLRQAEQSFKYLVDKFPGAEGGYSGLAKVYFEQDDHAAALRVLREGAMALSKSGERSAAITLLRKAVGLDPRDLAIHRRLAAALALAGDTDAAVQEYARFIRDLRANGETERAKNEVAYAKGQLRGVSGVASLDEIAQSAPAIADKPAAVEPPAEETVRLSEHEHSTALRPQAADPWLASRTEQPAAFTPPTPPQSVTPTEDPWASPPPTTSVANEQVREITLENDPWSTPPLRTAATRWPPVEEVEPIEPPPQETATEAAPEAEAPAAEPESTQSTESPEAPPASANGEPAAEADPEAVEAAAAQFLATRDPRAAGMALEAARYYIKEGHNDAASDLLLQLIAAGVADHDAQRLLVDVARTLGKREVAKTKCQLLVQALLLDGRNDLAAEVEALALGE
jgi:thioredoxin-like negative regulator of GroEL